MTKEELEKATGQELIEQRDYCGRDGYYRDYLDDVNEEMLKRFNCLAELKADNDARKFAMAMSEKVEKQLREQIEKMKCCANCKHKKNEVDRCELLMYSLNACLCKNKDKWELKND